MSLVKFTPKKRVKTKWELKRERLMVNDTYRIIIQRVEGDAETFHRIRLHMQVRKEQPGAAYTPVEV